MSLRAKLCDGTEVKYEPQYEDNICGECDNVVGKWIVNEPSFHGEAEKRGKDWYCTRCGNILVSYAATVTILDRIRPKIIEEIERKSPFYKFIKK